MRIIIEYESSWRNSFLDGSNNEALPKKGRKFVASMRNLKEGSNFIKREISLNTVMGLINRLIGDQRKLYQSRESENYYFHQLEHLVSFNVVDKLITDNEMTYIRNITGSTDQNSFTGMIRVNDVVFKSDYSKELWGILSLDTDELFSFIVNDNKVEALVGLDPISICTKFDELKKVRKIEVGGMAEKAVKRLATKFFSGDETKYYSNRKGKTDPTINPTAVYCSALYWQLERLSSRFDVSSAKTKSGCISGISKEGSFTKKDFMKRFTTGERKKVFGNPYIRKERIKGKGEIVSMMTKASGTLEISIDTDRDKAEEIKTMIENAGVSSFYLGKKGLAYVTDIDTREIRSQ